MPRPRARTGERPRCPNGHDGDVWLDGYYARGQFHERPRWVCLPRLDPATRKRPPLHRDGSRAHKFVEPLPRRHPTANHPLGGHTCAECERVLDRHEGPQTARRQIFSMREVANALVEVSHGRSLRKASAGTRDSAQRLITDAWGQRRPSRHGQLTADQLAMFGTIVRDELMPDTWPDEVALDESSVGITLTETDAKGRKHTHATSLYILGVYGYAAGKGSGRAIRLAARGGYDKVEWEAVLRSRKGEPSWVVCDGGKAVKAAVKLVWPNAMIYTCEGHLKMLLEDNLAADGHVGMIRSRMDCRRRSPVGRHGKSWSNVSQPLVLPRPWHGYAQSGRRWSSSGRSATRSGRFPSGRSNRCSRRSRTAWATAATSSATRRGLS